MNRKKQRCRTILFIKSVAKEYFLVTILQWTDHGNQVVAVPTSSLPPKLRKKIFPGAMVVALVNIDAETAADLNIGVFEEVIDPKDIPTLEELSGPILKPEKQ